MIGKITIKPSSHQITTTIRCCDMFSLFRQITELTPAKANLLFSLFLIHQRNKVNFTIKKRLRHQMNASCNKTLRPHSRRPLKRLFSKKPVSSQPVVTEQVKTEIIPENDSVGAAMRNEKIASARSIAIAVQQQRQQKTASGISIMQNALLERLEAKLLKNEIECTELRKLVEARKRGVPVSLASLHLGFEQENDVSLGDSYLLKKLEAVVVLKEEECKKARRLSNEARKRGISQAQKDSLCESLSTHLGKPKSVLRSRSSSSTVSLSTHLTSNKKSVLRSRSSCSTKSVTWGSSCA
jgi:hypothetical protein